MSSKMRMVRKMIVSDETDSDIADISSSKQIKYKKKNPELSPLVTDDSNCNSSSNQNSVPLRVCVDCHTTKTPLWRSGPKGPKVHIFSISLFKPLTTFFACNFL